MIKHLDMANENLNMPLLSVNTINSTMRETKVEITQYGELALNGELDVVKENQKLRTMIFE